MILCKDEKGRADKVPKLIVMKLEMRKSLLGYVFDVTLEPI
jgi:hypothetical protein